MPAVSFTPCAITLDLDDTLWPFAPIGERIEHALHQWLREHSPRTAEHFDIAAMRALREQVWREHPEHAHDVSLLRRMTIQRALDDSGGDSALADAAYEIFYRERNRVSFYPDALAALQRLAARVPVAGLTNGNADLAAIGIDGHFVFNLAARDHGAAKPAASLFHAACERLAVPAHAVLHVGDHPHMDVEGARRAGLRSCWINRVGATWPRELPAPDLAFTDLAELADWFDARPNPTRTPR
ncbi:MAG: HAD-IA family hydrolase [Pseudoxanthomonas suwonensis]|nr:HAD-IA family hydrolase [Pseudoxanthomonas suwonensis]